MSEYIETELLLVEVWWINASEVIQMNRKCACLNFFCVVFDNALSTLLSIVLINTFLIYIILLDFIFLKILHNMSQLFFVKSISRIHVIPIIREIWILHSLLEK